MRPYFPWHERRPYDAVIESTAGLECISNYHVLKDQIMKNGLLIGGHASYLTRLNEAIDTDVAVLFIASGVDDVRRILADEVINVVFLGRERDPAYRLQILKNIFSVSPTLPVHVMGVDSDPVKFIARILNGPADYKAMPNVQ
jgi:hypothetical protein